MKSTRILKCIFSHLKTAFTFLPMHGKAAQNLQRPWRKLWPYKEEKDDKLEGDIDVVVKKIREIYSTLPGLEQSDKDGVVGH